MTKKPRKARTCSYILKDVAYLVDDIEEMYRQGAKDKDIYTMLGVSIQTFYKWMREGEDPDCLYHPLYLARLNGQAASVNTVMRTAFRLMTGNYEQERVFLDTSGGEPREFRYYENLPPDVRMLMRYLANVKPELFADNKKGNATTVNVSGGDTVQLGNLSDAMLSEFREFLEYKQNQVIANEGVTSVSVSEDEFDEEPIDEGDV